MSPTGAFVALAFEITDSITFTQTGHSVRMSTTPTRSSVRMINAQMAAPAKTIVFRLATMNSIFGHQYSTSRFNIRLLLGAHRNPINTSSHRVDAGALCKLITDQGDDRAKIAFAYVRRLIKVAPSGYAHRGGGDWHSLWT